MGLRWMCVLVLGIAGAVAQEGTESITGTVVDPTGAVIPNTRILVSGITSLEARTDAAGEFTVRGLGPGSYLLKLKSPGFRTRSRQVSLQRGQTVSLGSIELRFGPIACDGEWIPGQVTEEQIDQDTAPRLSGLVQGAYNMTKVFIVLYKAGTSEVMAVTRADGGEFEFPDLPPGPYKVEVSHNGRTHLAIRNLMLKRGFDAELVTGWGTGLCVEAR